MTDTQNTSALERIERTLNEQRNRGAGACDRFEVEELSAREREALRADALALLDAAQPPAAIVRESDLPGVTWDESRGVWETPDAILRPAGYTPEELDERERTALASLALVRHARSHEPPKPEPAGDELAVLDREHLARLIDEQAFREDPRFALGDISWARPDLASRRRTALQAADRIVADLSRGADREVARTQDEASAAVRPTSATASAEQPAPATTRRVCILCGEAWDCLPTGEDTAACLRCLNAPASSVREELARVIAPEVWWDADDAALSLPGVQEARRRAFALADSVLVWLAARRPASSIGDREALAVEFRERLDDADSDERVLTEHDLADVALAWFASHQPAPSAADREALRTAVWETQDGYSTTLRAEQTERILSAIEPYIAAHQPAPSAEDREVLANIEALVDGLRDVDQIGTTRGMVWVRDLRMLLLAARQPAPVDAEAVRVQALRDALAAVERVGWWTAGERVALTNAGNSIRAIIREAEVSRG